MGLLIQDAETVCEIKEYVKALSERGAKSRGAAKSPRGKMAKSNKGTKRDVRKRLDIPRGAQLTRTYKNKICTCIVELPRGDPKVGYKNKRGLSLSEAAREVTGSESISGPQFWW